LKLEKTYTTDGQQAKKGDNVSVHYTGKLRNGTVFDTSSKRGKPFDFELGAGGVIDCWDEGIAMLKVGEKARLTCPSDIAYGSQGMGNIIPPNATLYFDVELVSINNGTY